MGSAPVRRRGEHEAHAADRGGGHHVEQAGGVAGEHGRCAGGALRRGEGDVGFGQRREAGFDVNSAGEVSATGQPVTINVAASRPQPARRGVCRWLRRRAAMTARASCGPTARSMTRSDGWVRLWTSRMPIASDMASPLLGAGTDHTVIGTGGSPGTTSPTGTGAQGAGGPDGGAPDTDRTRPVPF